MNTVTTVAMQNSLNMTIKTSRDFDSVARQCSHLSLREGEGGPPVNSPFVPFQRHLNSPTLPPGQLVSRRGHQSEEGPSVRGSARLGVSASAVGGLVSRQEVLAGPCGHPGHRLPRWTRPHTSASHPGPEAAPLPHHVLLRRPLGARSASCGWDSYSGALPPLLPFVRHTEPGGFGPGP